MSDENRLTKVTTLGVNDLIRVVVGTASRNITLDNFGNAIKPVLEALGFLTSDNLPPIVANSRLVETFAVNVNINNNHDLVLMNATGGNLQVVMPAAATFYDSDDDKGQRVTIKKIDASNVNTVTIFPTGAELIDGETSVVLETDSRPFVNIVSDGFNWWLI